MFQRKEGEGKKEGKEGEQGEDKEEEDGKGGGGRREEAIDASKMFVLHNY